MRMLAEVLLGDDVGFGRNPNEGPLWGCCQEETCERVRSQVRRVGWVDWLGETHLQEPRQHSDFMDVLGNEITGRRQERGPSG